MPARERRPRPRQRRARSNRSRSITFVHAATKSRDQLGLPVGAAVDLGQGPELGARAEDEVDPGGGPPERAGLAVAALEHVLAASDRPPLRAHVEQVHEEVVGQRPRPVGEDAVARPADVGAEDPQAPDEHRHLGRGQGEQLRLVDQQDLGGRRGRAREVVAEAIGARFEHGEGLDVGLVLGGIHAPRRERHDHGWPASLAACSTAAPPASTMRSASETRLPPACAPVERALDALQGREHLRELRRLVDRPVLLRREPDAGAVGAAALVRAAEGRRRGPRDRHQLRDGQARGEDVAPQRGDVGASISGWSTAGIGSCQRSSSAGTSGPR